MISNRAKEMTGFSEVESEGITSEYIVINFPGTQINTLAGTWARVNLFLIIIYIIIILIIILIILTPILRQELSWSKFPPPTQPNFYLITLACYGKPTELYILEKIILLQLILVRFYQLLYQSLKVCFISIKG